MNLGEEMNTHDIELPPLPSPFGIVDPMGSGEKIYTLKDMGDYARAYARAALQSQSNHDTTLFCDLKTDEEKYAFFLSGRGYETGVIARAIQNDVAMAYHRCAEYKKQLDALQSQDREKRLVAAIREAIELLGPEAPLCSGCEYEWNHALRVLREAIDHARRIEGES